jgi:hypothetical protein
MRHSPARLLDPLTLPGALVPGLRSQFGGVLSERVPEPLTALMRRLGGAQDNEIQEIQNDARTQGQAHGSGTANTTHRIDRRGQR